MADRLNEANQDTLDDLLINNMKVFQARQGYRFSIDAVLLAHFPDLDKVKRIIDIGTGSGVIPLLLAQQTGAVITGIEIQEAMVARAKKSVQLNNLQSQISIIQADANQIQNLLPAGWADLVVSNPPYWKKGEGKLSSNPEEAIARHEIKLTLEQLVQQASYLLLPRGKLALIQRADRLQELLVLLTKHRFSLHRLRMVHSNSKTEARMILLEAVKGARPGSKIMPSLYIYQEDGSYTPEIEEMYKNEGKNLDRG